ncbi:hypothetical protein, partial [Thermodesulfatator indicus]
KFSGSMLNLVGASNNITGIDSGDYSDANKEGDIFGATRVRPTMTVTSDDGMAKFVYGAEIGGAVWGDGSSVGKSVGFGFEGDGVNVETRLAYGVFSLEPFGAPGAVAMGLQPVSINGAVYDDNAAGITYDYKTDAYSLLLGYVWNNAKANGFSNNDDHLAVIKLDYKVDDTTTLGGFFAYEDPYGPDNTKYYFGFTGNTMVDPVELAWDIIYLGGSAAKDVDRSAWYMDFTAGFQVNEQLKLAGSVIYSSGDDDPNVDKNKTFEDAEKSKNMAPGILFANGYLGAFIGGASYDQYGYFGLMLDSAYKIDDKSSLKGAVIWHNLAKDNAAGDKDLGLELNGTYEYAYNQNTTFFAEAAYLVVGDALAKNADDVYYIGSGFKFKF